MDLCTEWGQGVLFALRKRHYNEVLIMADRRKLLETLQDSRDSRAMPSKLQNTSNVKSRVPCRLLSYIFLAIAGLNVIFWVLKPYMIQINHDTLDSCRMSLTVLVKNSPTLSGRFFQRGQRSFFSCSFHHVVLKTSR